MKVLFICKKNETYGFTTYCRRSSGLYNSTRFIVEAMRALGIEAEIVEVNDNNDIDREVRAYMPDVVIIEALWVVPEKFPILQKLHPNVSWYVHMHSGLPFLAYEGIAMDWLSRYPGVGVGIIANSPETAEAFRIVAPDSSVTYLPNVYLPTFYPPVNKKRHKDCLDVGCFGAIRPMKNHLAQALAAIKFAESEGKVLRFHVNGSRIELGGQPCLKNLIQLFEHKSPHQLVLQPWMEHYEFLDLLNHQIDIGMQVSLTETFNVVTADYVTAGLPVVVSKEVRWASRLNRALDDSPDDIARIMGRVWGFKKLIKWNQRLLGWNSEEAIELWSDWLTLRA